MTGPKTLTLLQINDTHGYLEPHPELFWEGSQTQNREAGGYARIRSIFDVARREAGGPVSAFDNGDTFHGTYHAVQTKGEAFIEPVNLLGLDLQILWPARFGAAWSRMA